MRTARIITSRLLTQICIRLVRQALDKIHDSSCGRHRVFVHHRFVYCVLPEEEHFRGGEIGTGANPPLIRGPVGWYLIDGWHVVCFKRFESCLYIHQSLRSHRQWHSNVTRLKGFSLSAVKYRWRVRQIRQSRSMESASVMEAEQREASLPVGSIQQTKTLQR
jgi:hypothetical protein